MITLLGFVSVPIIGRPNPSELILSRVAVTCVFLLPRIVRLNINTHDYRRLASHAPRAIVNERWLTYES